MQETRQAIKLHVQEFHLRIVHCQAPEVPFMPCRDSCLDKSIPLFFWPCWCLQEGERWGEAVLHADQLNMVCPGGGVAVAHLEYVQEHGVYSTAWIRPYVME